MKHIIAFSGGIQSAYAAFLVQRRFGKENIILLFHDTKSEHPDNERFRSQVSDFIEIPVTEVSDGRDIWQLFRDKKYIGNQFRPICSYNLKKKQAEKFYRELLKQGEEFIVYFGFSREEWRRAQRMAARIEHQGFKVGFPLFWSGTGDAKKVLLSWDICPPQQYRWFKHANCIPCVRGNKGHFEKVWHSFPDRYLKTEAIEEELKQTILSDISLKNLREQFEMYPQQQLFSDEVVLPCECMV